MERNIDGVLVKYMLGETSASEQEYIDKWLAADEVNRKYFAHFKMIWNAGETLKTVSNLDPEASWQEFKQLRAEAKQKAPANVRQLISRRWLSVAAMWLVIAGAGVAIFTYLQSGGAEMLTLTAGDQVRTDTLSDGSVVTLNKRSALTYPAKFTGNLREVTLSQGEAFFDIASNKSKPFIISVNDLQVRVVGTSFNIRKMKSSTEVIVETGNVQVARKKLVIKLAPNEKVNVEVGSDDYQKQQLTDKLYNYYLTQQFVANKTPLWRVAEILSEAYGVKIRINGKRLQNMQLSTILPNGQLDNNISIICQTLNVRATKKDGGIIIE